MIEGVERQWRQCFLDGRGLHSPVACAPKNIQCLSAMILTSVLGEKIFQLFYTTKQNGLGMGLSISRSIIETHGGQLWAQNNPDRGATFYFTVPIVREVTDETNESNSYGDKGAQRQSHTQRQGQRVLSR